jgi:hypothetical protein
MLCLAAALIPPSGSRDHRKREQNMRNNKYGVAAAVGSIVWGSVGLGMAVAADVPVPLPPPSEYYGNSTEYYGDPPVLEPRYPYRLPPSAYGYPPPPPYYYYDYYTPPPLAVVPEPYYRRRYYEPLYGGPAYGVRSYYGRYGRYSYRGHHRW